MYDKFSFFQFYIVLQLFSLWINLIIFLINPFIPYYSQI